MSIPLRVSLAALLLLPGAVLGAGSAEADLASYEQLAKAARPLPGLEALRALSWAREPACDDIKDDMRRRQCAIVSRARRRNIVQRTYRLSLPEPGLALGAFDTTTSMAPLSFSTCLDCARPGEKGRLVHEEQLRFDSAAARERFSKVVFPRLRSEVIVAPSSEFEASAPVRLLGYRVVDPCTGHIYAANPPSKNVRADAAACPLKKRGIPESALPRSASIPLAAFSHAVLATRLAPLHRQAKQCYATYEVRGAARITLIVADDGVVLRAEERGDFADTPTGTCLLEAAHELQFPATGVERARVEVPLSLP